MDLPFQWDDGRFVSPFVASSEGYLAPVSDWILRHLLLPTLERYVGARDARHGSRDQLGQAEQPRVVVHMRLADLGCGDGSALFFLCQHLARAWQARVNGVVTTTTTITQDALNSGTGPCTEDTTSVPNELQEVLRRAHLHITTFGADLDETLVEQAAIASKAASGGDSPNVKVTHTFTCEDIRHCDLAVHFPPSETGEFEECVMLDTDGGDGAEELGRDRGCVHVRAPSVLYLYLIPEGLEAIKEAVLSIAGPRGWVVVSNRWAVPYLQEASLTVEKVGLVTVYHHGKRGGEGLGAP